MRNCRRSIGMLAGCMGAVVLAGGALPLSAADAPTQEAKQAYERKWTADELEAAREASEAWFGGSIRMDYAPPPWTPMAVNGQDIESWGKVYGYRDSLLPVTMTSQGVDLLAGEPRFILKADGREHRFREAEVAIERVHDGLVRAKATSQSGPFTLEVSADYEFDGMGKVEVVLSGRGTPTVESLHLEMPLSADRMELFHVAGSRFGLTVDGVLTRGAAAPPLSDSGTLPDEAVRLDTFREILWFGDQEVGLSWFADGMDGWRIGDEVDIQELEAARDGGRILRVKFADKRFRLDEPVRLVFGLQATPMRPRPADFRSRVGWRESSFSGPFDLNWRWGDGYYYPFHDTRPEAARAEVEAKRAEGVEILTTSSVEYFGPHRFFANTHGEVDHPGMIHREVLLWKDVWDQVRRVDGPPSDAQKRKEAALRRREQGEPGGRSVEQVLALERHTAEGDWYGKKWKPSSYPERFCYNSAFRDFYSWKLLELVRQTGLGALYLDNQLYMCANPDHGCGYIDYRGEWAAQGNVFAMREATKQIYFAFVEGNGDAPRLMWHSSQQMVIPAISFVDIFWDGEKYTIPDHERSILGQEFYSGFLNEGVMQVQHMGQPFGFTADFLPQLTREQLRDLPITSPSVASARDLMGLLLVHDSHIDAFRPLTYHGDLIGHILTKRASYPLEEMDVSYYWEEDAPVQVEQPRVRFIMHHDDEQAMVILFNWSDEPQRAKVTIDLPTGVTKTGQSHVQDAFSGEGLGDDPRSFEVDLLPRDFRMLDVRW